MTKLTATRLLARGNSAVAIGSVVAAVCGIAFIFLTERHLPVAEFESVAHLWTIWSIAGAVATFSMQQWIIKARRDGFVPLSQLLPAKLITAVVALAVAAFAFATAFRADLFASSNLTWPIAAAAIPVGSVVMGVTRGLWASEDLFTGLGVVLALENVLRVAAAGLFVVLGFAGEWFALALLAGFVATAVVPRSRPVTTVDTDTSTLPSTNLLLATAIAGFFSHTNITGGATILAVTGASDAPVAELFLVLTLARLPLLVVVLGLIPVYAVRVNAFVVAQDHRSIALMRRRLLTGGPVVATIAGIVGAYVSPWILTIVFDTERELQRLDYGLAIALAILAGTALTANTALVAEGRSRFQVAAWGVPSVAGLALLFLLPQPSARVVLSTIFVIECIIVVLLTLVASRTHRA